MPWPLPGMSEDNMAKHEYQEVLWENYQSLLKMMEADLDVEEYGRVEKERYDEVVAEAEGLKQRITDSGAREDMIKFFRTHWPWRDTLNS